MWRLIQGIIPTKSRLQEKGIQIDNQCVVCGSQRESIKHVLFECDFSRGVWQNSILEMIQQAEFGMETEQSWNQIFMLLQNEGMVEQGMYILWLL